MLNFTQSSKKILSALTVVIIVSVQTYGVFASEQVICNGTVTNLNTSVSLYGTVMGMPTDTYSLTESDHESIVPVDGRFKKLIVETEVDPNPGNWAFKLRVNNADTALQCGIASGATTCTSTEIVNVSAGDNVAFSTRPLSSPAGGDAYWSFLFEPNIRGYSILMGATGGVNMTTGTTEYFPLHGHKASETTLTDVETVIPLEGTVRNLYIDLQGTAPGAGKSYTFTVLKNGVATAVTCTVTGAATTTCSDTSNTVDVTAGDAIVLQKTAAGTPTAAKASYGVVVQTDTEGEFIIAVSSDDPMNPTGTLEYMYGSAGDGNWNTTETTRNQICLAMELQALYVELSQSPGGAGGNWVVASRSDGVTGLACFITEPATTCNGAGTITYTDGAGINYVNREVADATNTPNANMALKGYIEPKPKKGAIMVVH